MKGNIETTLSALSMLENKTRIMGLESLVRTLNRELWLKNRTGIGKRIIVFLEAKKGWYSVRQISDELGGLRDSVAKIMRELAECGLVERRNLDVVKTIYPENWEDMGDYARRQWRKRNGMPHRFQTQYEYRMIC